VVGNAQTPRVGVEEIPSDFSDFSAFPPWAAVTDWADSFNFDELLLGGEFGILQDVIQIMEA
jgi:hypothetical protein